MRRKSGGGELMGGLRDDREVFLTGRPAGLQCNGPDGCQHESEMSYEMRRIQAHVCVRISRMSLTCLAMVHGTARSGTEGRL
jgi:hypothetical protein